MDAPSATPSGDFSSAEAVDQLSRRILAAASRDRLVATARALISVPSPTGDAGRAADRLADLLEEEGLSVERHEAGHAAAPAVVARLAGEHPGPTLQFDGHLDTVHLPFAPPSEAGGLLRGSGAADMKGGLAAAVEALRILRSLGLPGRGAVLLVAHDLHEAPWGMGEQLERLIEQGIAGDAVLIPEPLSAMLPVAGRGAAVWKATLERNGEAVHEVMRDPDAPSVIAAASEAILEIERLDARLRDGAAGSLAGPLSVFVGQLHAGEIYNQLPVRASLEGTRRWLAGASAEEAEGEAKAELEAILEGVARPRGLGARLEFRRIRGAFTLDAQGELVRVFDEACERVRGARLPRGPKPFVDDGNTFSSMAGIPAITHGPRAGGQHTQEEWVDIDDLVRVARLYALAAALYCSREGAGKP